MSRHYLNFEKPIQVLDEQILELDSTTDPGQDELKTLANLQEKRIKVIEKIVEGQLKKYFSEVCLYEQSFVKDEKMTVGELISERIISTKENINLRRFERFKLGEGIEKRKQDFVAEVAAQLG